MKRMLLILTALFLSFAIGCKAEYLPGLNEIKDTWVYVEGSTYKEVLTLERGDFTWTTKQGATAELDEGSVIKQVTGTFRTKVYTNYGQLAYALELTPAETGQQFTLNCEFTEGAEAVWLQTGDKKNLFVRKSRFDRQFEAAEEAE